MRKRSSSQYSVYDKSGRRLVTSADRDVAVRVYDQAKQSGLMDVTLISRRSDDTPGPRVLDRP